MIYIPIDIIILWLFYKIIKQAYIDFLGLVDMFLDWTEKEETVFWFNNKNKEG